MHTTKRIRVISAAASSVAAACMALPVLADSERQCTPTPETHAYRIQGKNLAGELTDLEYPQVYGTSHFYQTLDNDWIFSLQRSETGWSVRLYDGEPVGDAIDLTALTPPHGGAPNPRDIFGWHFRNAANTGPNSGDVNASQTLRAFVISPSLQGTGGYRPGTDPNSPRHTDMSPTDGIGWLEVLDYGLAGTSLQPDQQARMNYLQFDACVSWRKSPAESTLDADATSLKYLPAEQEIFARCGVNLAHHSLEAHYLPRVLGGDIDGDGAADEVAQVRRKSDGRRGIALCRGGTSSALLGLGSEGQTNGLPPGKIDQIEAWHWVAAGAEIPPGIATVELPEAEGDILILERVEKEAVAIYWSNGVLHSKQLYHFVEPT
jgi:hypothetical protein